MKVCWHANEKEKNMRINLGNTPLFRGMTPPDIEEMLRCLRAAERTTLP